MKAEREARPPEPPRDPRPSRESRAAPDATASSTPSAESGERILASAREGILFVNADSGRITDVNRYVEDLLGYAQAELVGQRLWEIDPVTSHDSTRRAIRRLSKQESTLLPALSMKSRAGDELSVEVISSIVTVGGTRFIVCHVRDVTKERALARANRLNDQLLEVIHTMGQRDREMIRLHAMHISLNACTTHEQAYEVVARNAETLFIGKSGFLAIRKGMQRLQTVASWGDEPMAPPVFAPADCEAVASGKPHEFAGPLESAACAHVGDRPGTGSLCVPMTIDGEVMGVLCLQGPKDHAPFDAPRRRLAVAMGASVKISISNLTLRESLRADATVDVLTGLHNRRFLDHSLQREVHRAKRNHSPLCVALIDIDQFKTFNDNRGHAVGDAALRELGELLRDTVRKSDISCRYGGDEFVLVFPDSSLENTRMRVEQVRERVRALRFGSAAGVPGRISISAGVAQADAVSATSAGLLLVADKAMYAAKQAGGDRVAVGPSPS